MSPDRATGLRAASARLGRVAAGLGGLPRRVVMWGGEHRAAAAAVVIIGAEVAAGAIIVRAPLRPGGAEPVRPYAGAAATFPARPPYPLWAAPPPRYAGVYEPTRAAGRAVGPRRARGGHVAADRDYLQRVVPEFQVEIRRRRPYGRCDPADPDRAPRARNSPP